MKVVVTGATGFIGRALVRALLDRGDSVVALSRGIASAHAALSPDVEVVQWDAKNQGPWSRVMETADAVVNLAGEPVGYMRWTKAKMDRILSSRVDATRAIVEAVVRAEHRPGVLVNASGIDVYGSRGDMTLTEATPVQPNYFLARVAQQWEEATEPAGEQGVRVVLLRTALVLGEGGSLQAMALPFKLFGGGTLGTPGQWVSWIHIDDEIGMILFALDRDDVRGPLNATAPNPVTIDVFSQQIARATGRPSWVPFVGLGMKLALGDLADVLLASRKVLPEAAIQHGYMFLHSDSGEALRELLG